MLETVSEKFITSVVVQEQVRGTCAMACDNEDLQQTGYRSRQLSLSRAEL